MAVDKERAKKLLGIGLGVEVVSQTLGCEASYISQLLADETFRAQVAELRMENLTAATERDRSIDSLESNLISKLHDSVEYLTKPKEILQAFAVVNAAKRRGAGNMQQPAQINQTIVQLTMPTQIVQKFVTNAKGEVVEVSDSRGNSQALLTMSAQNLLGVLKDRKAAAGNEQAAAEIDSIARRLPQAILSRA